MLSIALSSCEPNRYAAEDELLISYYSQFPDSGATQKTNYNFIERQLVENSIIPDTTADTYNYTIHYIWGNKVTPFEASLILNHELEPYLVEQPRLGVDSIAIATVANKHPNSPLAKTLQSLVGSAFNDSAFVEQLLRHVSTDDLHHELYRHLALMYIAKMHEKKAQLWDKEYAPSGKSVFITRNNTLTFVIDSAGAVKHNETDIALAEVAHITRNFITQDSSKANWVEGRISLIGKQYINTGVIILGISPKAPQRELVLVYHQINQAFTQKRKESAQKFFKKDYFKLSKNERSALQLLTRKWISIHELDDQPL